MGRNMDDAQMRYLVLTGEKPRLYVRRGWKDACLDRICAMSGCGRDEIDVIEDDAIQAGAGGIGTDEDALHAARINPFTCPKGCMPASHIESLTVMLERCLDLPQDMHWLLRDAIRRAYVLCGWDLSGLYSSGPQAETPTFFDLLSVLSSEEDAISGKGAARETALRLRILTQDIAQRIFLSGTETDSAATGDGAWIALGHIWPSELRALLVSSILLRKREEKQGNEAFSPETEEKIKKAVSHVIGEIYRAQDKLPDRKRMEDILDRGGVSRARKEAILAQYDLLAGKLEAGGHIARKDRAAFAIRVSGCAGIAERIRLPDQGKDPKAVYDQYLIWKAKAASAMEAYIGSGMPNRAERMASDLIVYMAQVAGDAHYKKILGKLKAYEDARFEMPKDDVPLM